MEREIERLRDVINSFTLGAPRFSDWSAQSVYDKKALENIFRAKETISSTVANLVRRGQLPIRQRAADTGVTSEASVGASSQLDEAVSLCVVQQAAWNHALLTDKIQELLCGGGADGLTEEKMHTRKVVLEQLADLGKKLLSAQQMLQDLHKGSVGIINAMKQLQEEIAEHKEYLRKEQAKLEAEKTEEERQMEERIEKRLARINLIRMLATAFLVSEPTLINDRMFEILQRVRRKVTTDNVMEQH